MSGYRFVEIAGGLGRPQAAPDRKRREHTAPRLVLDLCAQTARGTKMPSETAPALHIRQRLEYGAIRHTILDRVGKIPGRLRRCDSGGARKDGLPIRTVWSSATARSRPMICRSRSRCRT